MESTGYHNLTNGQIVFIYLQNKIFFDKYEKVFADGGISIDVDIPLLGSMKHFHKMPKASLEKTKNSTHYKYCIEVMEKLRPIVDLIQAVEPKMYSDMEITVEKGDIKI